MVLFVITAIMVCRFAFTPLRRALNNNMDESLITDLLHANPASARELDILGRLALHVAATRKLSVGIVRALVAAYPDGAAVMDKYGQLPVQLALKRGCGSDVIEVMLDAFSDAATVRDKYGFLPLHTAIESGTSTDIIELLLLHAPHTAGEMVSGKLPLHLAVEFKRFELIPKLLEAHRPAVKEPDSKGGRIPFVLALERCAPLSVLSQLYDEYPRQSAFVMDNNGMLAIHYAVKYHAPVEIIRLLLAANLDVIFEKVDLPCAFFQFVPPNPSTLATLSTWAGSGPDSINMSSSVTQAGEGGVSCDGMQGAVTIHYESSTETPEFEVRGNLRDFNSSTSISEQNLVVGMAELEGQSIEDTDAHVVQHETTNPIKGSNAGERLRSEPFRGAHRRSGEVSGGSAEFIEPGPGRSGPVLIPICSVGIPSKVQSMKAGGEMGKISKRSSQPINNSVYGKPTSSALEKSRGTEMSPFTATTAAVMKYATRQWKMLIHFAAEDCRAPADIIAELLQYTMPITAKTGARNILHNFTWTFILGETEDRCE